jgi:hypothetical protein
MHCQIFELRGPDPQIARKLSLLMGAGQAMQLWLTEVSYDVCSAYSRFVTALEAQEAGLKPNGNARRRRSSEQVPRSLEDLAEAKALWTGLSRRWKELERARQWFCDNHGLDGNWPFAQNELAQMAVGRIPGPDSIIDVARKIVDPDADPNPEVVEHVYRALRNHWEYPSMSDHGKRE